MEKIPVNIISGFLGSGKTTAIIRLLNEKTNDEQWAVIINEFGKVTIDGQTLRSSTEAGNVFEVSGGCICCSAKGYFQENLEKILKNGNYTRIIIEPSGIGGIDIVSEIVKAIPQLQLMPVICLVDLTAIENSKLRSFPVYRNQISKADLIVFSKSDLIIEASEKKRLIGKFKTIFPVKESYFIASENISLDSLLKNDFGLKKENDPYLNLMYANPDTSDDNYQQKYYKFDTETIFDPVKLNHFFENQPQIIRAKGHIKTNKGWMLLNFTLSGYTFEPCDEKEFSEIVIISGKSKVYPNQDFSVELASIISSN
jgi:G3E family GTPase